MQFYFEAKVKWAQIQNTLLNIYASDFLEILPKFEVTDVKWLEHLDLTIRFTKS